MIPIPDNFKRNGFWYTLVSKGRRSLIYAQHGYGRIVDYVVIKIKYRPEREIKDIVLPPCLRFPCNEDFGIWAWNYPCFFEPGKALIRAKEKFRELEL